MTRPAPTALLARAWSRLACLRPAGLLRALCLLAGLVALAAPALAQRAFTQRYSGNVSGDVYLVGNALESCPVAATNCAAARSGGAYANNEFSMEYINIDSDATIFNASNATLSMPAGSSVVFAGLYWSGNSSAAARGQALFKAPGAFGYAAVSASQVDQVVNTVGATTRSAYQAYANVTAQVKAGGSGSYAVANVQSSNNGSTTLNQISDWAGWALVVVFSNNAQPVRNVVVYDGFSAIDKNAPVALTVSGFLTPLSGPVVTRLGSVAYNGQLGMLGSSSNSAGSFKLNGTAIGDAANPSSNFFNASISELGASVSSRSPSYLNTLGLDIDRVNVPTGLVANGDSAATLNLSSSVATVYPGVITFATNLYAPVIAPNLTMTVADLNGGLLLAGDVLRYTIGVSNTGQDGATNVAVSDAIPAGTTYVPGSLKVTSGANSGGKSDAAGDDTGEYIASGTPRIVLRLGANASASAGGLLASGAASAATFDVTLNTGLAPGTLISNSADVSYSAQTQGGALVASTPAASISVSAAPQLSAAFSPASVDVNGAAQLSIVVSNPAANPATLTGVTFSDAYPAGLVNSAAPGASVVCTAGATAGSLTGGAAGGAGIGMAPGATLPPNASCTIKVSVTAAARGRYVNASGAPASSNGGSGSAASATLGVGGLALSQTFATSPVTTGQASVLTLTVSNPLAVAVSAVGFSDAYPSGLVNAATPAASTTCTGGSVAAAAGGASLALSGASLAANASCTVSVSVSSAAAGLYANTSAGASSAQTSGAGLASNTATLTVLGPAAGAMQFAPAAISLNGQSLLTISVSNPNTGTTLTGVALSDSYPSGLVNAASASPTLNCSSGSSATLAGGANAGAGIGITAGTLLAGGSCSVTVYVTSASAASYSNASGAIASSNGGSGGAAGAVLSVVTLTAPTLAMAVLPATIAKGASAVLTITLSNSNASAISGAAFTDVYPSNLVNAATPAASTSCAGATLAAPAGAASVALSGATIPANGSCTVTLSVTAGQAGNFYNALPAGAVSSANAGSNSAAASANLGVLGPPAIAKAFSSAAVAVNTNVVMTITLSNPGDNSAALSGVAFSDTYPAGLVNGSVPAVANSCGGTASAAPGGNTLTLSGAALAVGANCSVKVTVTAATAATYTNTTGAVSAGNGGSGATASASLAVGRPLISMAFGTSPINSGATSQLSISITNPTTSAMSGAAFTNTYPAGMSNAPVPAAALSGVGCSGTLSAASNGASISLAGATLPANTSCVVAVTLSATQTLQNVIAAGALSVSGGASNDVAAQATLVVNPPPQASMAFAPAVVVAGASSTLTITIVNPNSAAMAGVAFSDSYPAGLVNAATPAASSTCGGSVTAAAGAASLTLSSASVPANSNCSVTVSVASASGAAYTNSSGAVTSTSSGAGAPASAVLTVMAPPAVTSAFSPAQVGVGSAAVLSITLTNPNSVAVTGAAFSDSYPSGLAGTASMDAATSCGGATLVSSAGALALSGATIPAGASCSVTVSVSNTSAGSYANSTGAVSTGNAGTASAAGATLTVLANLGISLSFSPAAITSYGPASTLTFVIVNPNAGSAVSAMSFGDNLPANLVIATPNALVGTCGGSIDAAAGGSAYALTGGALAAGASCTLKVNVTSVLAGLYLNSSSGVSSSAGGPGAASASASLTVTAPDLRLALSHAGSFTTGLPGVYTLSASNAGSAATSGSVTVVLTLPAGLSFASASGSGWSCAASGQVVTCSSSASIAAAAPASALAITVAVNMQAAPSVIVYASIAGGSEPAASAGDNGAIDPTVVVKAGQNGFAPDGMQTAAPGSTVFYLHQFNAGVAGSVLFGISSAPDPSLPGWSGMLLRDANCSGAPNGTDGAQQLVGAITVAVGDLVCILVKEFVPASAPYNARDVLTVSATFTPSAGGSASTLTRSDTTLAGSAGGAGLVLQKSVRNVSAAGSSGISNGASSGDTLEYTISYSNASSSALAAITLRDMTPAFTHFASASCKLPLPAGISGCAATTQPALYGTGALEWTLSGSLSSAASGSVLFRVTVD